MRAIDLCQVDISRNLLSQGSIASKNYEKIPCPLEPEL